MSLIPPPVHVNNYAYACVGGKCGATPLKENNERKIFLDEIDGYVYSTNDYEIYSLYNRLLYDFNPHIKKSDNKTPPDCTPLPKDFWAKVTYKDKVIHEFENWWRFRTAKKIMEDTEMKK